MALKISFDHCAGRRSAKRLDLEPGGLDQPGDLLDDARTACPRTGRARSPCRGRTRPRCRSASCRDMNVTAETIGQSPCARTTSSAPRPLRVVIIVAPSEPAGERRGRLLEPGRLRRDDAEVERLELVRVRGRVHARVQVAPPGHAQPVAVERVRVLAPAGQDADVDDLREMTRVEAPDRPRPDDADTRIPGTGPTRPPWRSWPTRHGRAGSPRTRRAPGS